MGSIIALVGACALVLALIVYSGLSWGFVAWKFWYWFILPVFPNLPHVGFWQSVGIFMFICLFHSGGTSAIKDEYKDTSTQWANLLLTPWLTLLIGYVFLSLMK